MNRVFDPIDIVFIILILCYLGILISIVSILIYQKNKKANKPIKYKVVNVIHPKKKTKKKATTKKKSSTKKSSTPKKKNTTNTNKKTTNKKHTSKKK